MSDVLWPANVKCYKSQRDHSLHFQYRLSRQSLFLLTQLSVLQNINTIFWFSTLVYELFCYVRRQLHAQPRQAVRGFEEKEHILQPFKSRNKFPSQILSYVPSVSRRIYENGFVIILFSLSYHSFLTRGLTGSFEEIFSRILCESSHFLIRR